MHAMMPVIAAHHKWDRPPAVLKPDESLITENMNISQLATMAINTIPTSPATNFDRLLTPAPLFFIPATIPGSRGGQIGCATPARESEDRATWQRSVSLVLQQLADLASLESRTL